MVVHLPYIDIPAGKVTAVAADPAFASTVVDVCPEDTNSCDVSPVNVPNTVSSMN